MWWRSSQVDEDEQAPPLQPELPAEWPAPSPQPSSPSTEGARPSSKVNLVASLRALRAGLASAAQQIYDDWDQDGDGVDEHYGAGGICDDVAEAMAGVIMSAIPGAEAITNFDESSTHTSVYVLDEGSRQAAWVDIPPEVYERGAFYTWKKIPGVHLEGGHVQVHPIPYEEYAALAES